MALSKENGRFNAEDFYTIGAEIEAVETIKITTIEEFMDTNWYAPWLLQERRKQELKERGEPLFIELGRAPLPTDYGPFTYIEYGDKITGSHHKALVYGKLPFGQLTNGEDILVRIHSACWTNEVAHAANCECRKEIEETLTQIQREGRGILLYLDQEGRGTGTHGKLAQLNNMFYWDEGDQIDQRRDAQGGRIDTDRAYKMAGFPSECRDFEIAGQILQSLGVSSTRLLSNNAGKRAGVEAAGIQVTPVGIHIKPDNEIIASDLKSKAENLGHDIKPEHYQLDEAAD